MLAFTVAHLKCLEFSCLVIITEPRIYHWVGRHADYFYVTENRSKKKKKKVKVKKIKAILDSHLHNCNGTISYKVLFQICRSKFISNIKRVCVYKNQQSTYLGSTTKIYQYLILKAIFHKILDLRNPNNFV